MPRNVPSPRPLGWELSNVADGVSANPPYHTTESFHKKADSPAFCTPRLPTVFTTVGCGGLLPRGKAAMPRDAGKSVSTSLWVGKRRRKSPRRACARQTAQPTHGPRARRRNPGPIYIPGAGGTTTVAPGVLHFGAFAKRVYPHGRTMPGTRRALRSQWIQDSTGAR